MGHGVLIGDFELFVGSGLYIADMWMLFFPDLISIVVKEILVLRNICRFMRCLWTNTAIPPCSCESRYGFVSLQYV